MRVAARKSKAGQKDGGIALTGASAELTADGGSERSESVAAVSKVFAILHALGENDQTGISELAQRLVMSKSTVHRFLQTLKALGYVAQEEDTDRYRLTIRLFELGSKALESVD